MHSKCPSRRFTAVVIGKRLLALLAAALLAVIALISVFIVVAHNVSGWGEMFNLRMLSDAIPVVAAADDFTLMSDIETVVSVLTGLDTREHIGNIAQIPYFSNVDTAKKTIYVADMPTEAAVPAAKIAEQSAGDTQLKIKNETTYNVNTSALLDMPTRFEVSATQPQILIVHTHGTESYTQSEKYRYSDTDTSRCEDTRYNVVRVGEELAMELEERGFNVLHDKSLNDTPSYNNSYNKTLGVIESYLQKYPSIQCVFDVHRDAVEQEDGTKVKFTADIDGNKVSQVMLVCGSNGLGLEHPDWQYNLSFALKIQSYLNKTYPGLMRPVNLRKERFNMHKTPRSLILEFGTHGNTLDEALAAVEYVAEGIENAVK